VIVPAANPAGIASPADLARTGVKVVAAGAGVPITGYATQVVSSLARLAGYPTWFAAGYAANVVSREDSVKAVVAKIELGEGDAAIVYTTDGTASPRVRVVDIPADANVAVRYAGVVVNASPHPSEAHAFLAWLAGRDGQSVLATFGFEPVT
jgi:molybdate transport system substrate-binding protein